MLSKKIVTFVSLIILIIGAAVTLIVYNRISKTLIDLKEKEIFKLNTAQSRELNQIFNKSRDFVELIAIRTRVVDYLDKPTQAGKDELVGIFDEYPKLYSDYLAIYLMDLKGNTLVSTDRSFVGKNYGFRDYFIEAVKGRPFTEAVVGVTSKQFGYYFSHPVINKKGAVIGVVVAKLNSQSIDKILKADQSTRDSFLMLADSQGVVLYSQKPDRILKSVGQLTEKEKKLIIKKRKYGNRQITSLQYDLIQENIRKYTQSKIFNFNDLEDNEQEIVGIVKLENNPYFLITEIEASTLSAFAFEIAFVLSIAILLAAILALIIISIVISKYLQPLNQFQKFSQSVGEGIFDKRLDIKSKDEFGQLAQSFNTMADKLKESKQNIEKKVLDRTQQLQKINKFMTGREIKMIELKKRIKELEKNKN